MAGLYLAGLGLAALALLPFAAIPAFALTLADVTPGMYARAGALILLALALTTGNRLAWWLSLLTAVGYTTIGLLALASGQIGDWWLLSDQPRLLLLFNTLATGLAAGTASLLLLPTARAESGKGPARSASWRQFLIPPLVMILIAGVPAWIVLPGYPVLVVDDARVLSAKQEKTIARFHGLLRTDHDIDYRVLTGKGLGDLDRFAADYFRDHELGEASRTGRGLLLVLDVEQNEVRLEVGYALEPIFVDAFAAYIERQQMTEFFAAGRIADGILASTELLVSRADNAAAGIAPAEEAWVEGSGGGGARSMARLDQGGAERSHEDVESRGNGRPEDVLAAYRQAMARRNDNPRLSIYSDRTREMMAQRVMTNAQMDNVAKSLRDCTIEETFTRGNRAVLRPPIEDRTCSPYFLVREEGEWRLDFTVMIDALRFGRGNRWRLQPDYSGPYNFAFQDLRFDRNGYPYRAD